MSLPEIIFNNLPNVYVAKINIASNQEEYYIKIVLSLKDMLENGNSIWFGGPAQKYGKINLLSITTTTSDDAADLSRQKKIEDIKTKYPNVGIGDTETNENITEDFYDMLQWMKNELKDITD